MILLYFLIQRGGGTGPMMPGNRLNNTVLLPAEYVTLADKKRIPLFLKRGIFVWY
jgi:hypothetical protein